MKSAIVAASSLPSVPIRELSELEMLRALMSGDQRIELGLYAGQRLIGVAQRGHRGGGCFVELVEGMLRLIDE